MSLYSSMQTSVSGMAAQSNLLSTIADNIANAGTDGYKRAMTEFETLLGNNATSSYESGGVLTDIRYGIDAQGTIKTTTSATDLAISGNGFFAVSKGGSGTYLTRAGSFIPDANGNLVNTAGYSLMGYAIGADGNPSSTLSVINIASTTLQAAATTTGKLVANLPSDATAMTTAANLPSANASTATYTNKTSMTVYDSLGKAVVLDVYATKTSDDKWEVTAYNQANAASGGGFPYSSGPLATTNLTFDPTTGALASGSANSLSLTVPNGKAVSIDMSGMTQLATDFGVTTASANGNAPSQLDHIAISKDGTVNEVFASGATVATYKIPLANVNSPNNLTPITGDVFEVSTDSGSIVLSAATTAGTGSIISDALEQSTVDLATELTNMIQAQRGYEANSKVLQASSDLLSVLNRLSTG